MRRAAALALAASLAGAGCGPGGSGNVVSAPRDLPPFDRISVAEGLDLALELVPGASQRVTVTYDDNLLDRIGTVVVDGELRIEVLESFRVTGGGRLVSVVGGGIGVIRAESGSDVRVSGAVEEITVVAAGGAALDLSLLDARRVVVDAGGASYVAVRASESVRGTATGGAEVLVLGDPVTVDVAVSGGARLVSE